VQRFRDLYQRLELEWTAAAERFLTTANRRQGEGWAYSLHRVTARQVDGWRPRLTQGEIDACRRFVEPFDLPYYPDFEPAVASVTGDLPAR